MYLETAIVFGVFGNTIYTHLPPGRSTGYIPDSNALWNFLWSYRDIVRGVAHLHPWEGEAHPSHEDVTTFSAIERALGKQFTWPIATFDDSKYFRWVGPGKLDYAAQDPWRTNGAYDVGLLRYLSQGVSK